MPSEACENIERMKELERVIQSKEQYVNECAATLKEAKAALNQAVNDLRVQIREMKTGELELLFVPSGDPTITLDEDLAGRGVKEAGDGQ